MKLQKRRVTSKDWKIIHEIFINLKKTYPENTNRQNYFLISLFFFSTTNNINYDVAIKLRPYGGLIGIDNSSLDKYLYDSENFYECMLFYTMPPVLSAKVYNTGPTYCYVSPWKCNSSLIGHLSGITFCLYIKLKKPKLYHLLEC